MKGQQHIITVLFLAIATLSYPLRSQIVINEVCINNASTIYDFEHEYEDWIELYNAGTTIQNLAGYSITDNTLQPQKWVFPNAVLAPGDYLIIWASDKNLKKHPDTLHTNFKLSENETIALYNTSHTLVDAKQIPNTRLDHSFGRINNGSLDWAFMKPSSPKAPNLEASSFMTYNRDSIKFSLKAGFYTGAQELTLAGGTEIRYTTDGSEPSPSSPRYTGPIHIDSTQTIKACKFDNQSQPFYTWAATYFINEATKLPIWSISMDPTDLWDHHKGIYVLGPHADTVRPYTGANFWQDWERAAYVEYYDKQKINRISQHAGIRIYGNWSRAAEQKSLLIMAKSKYGNDRLRHKFYEDKSIDSFEDVILRNSGSDFNVTHFRDGFLQTTIGQFTGLDYQAYQPSVVFLNGKYWGIHNIREKISADFIAENHGINKSDVDLVETWGKALEGKNNIWDLEWNAANLNMANERTFKLVADSFDLNSMVDYMSAELYVSNWDWGGNNIKYWRNNKTDRKYKMILWDMDISLGLFDLAPVNSNNLDSIYNSKRPLSPTISIFKNFTRNLSFRNKFINRYADLMNSVFLPERFKATAYRFRDSIASEIPQHFAKWPPYDTWENHIMRMTDFIELRPPFARLQLQNQFSLGKQVALTLEIAPEGAGYIKINSIFTDSNPWTGIYYEGVPVQITAIPNPGYSFEYWQSPTLITDPLTSKSATLNINNNEKVTAHFSGAPSDLKLTLSEINYYSNTTKDAGDWIELHNHGIAPLDVSFWSIKDKNDYNKFSFPFNSIIMPDERVVLCSDTAKFRLVYGSQVKVFASLGFGLKNQGDEIRIYNHKADLYQKIAFNYYGIWDNKAFGQGHTLELKDPSLDPTLKESWSAGCESGSPTAEFNASCAVGITDEKHDLAEFSIIPNPTSGLFTLEIIEPIDHLQIFNVQGRLVSEYKQPTQGLLLDISQLQQGIYSIVIQTKTGKRLYSKAVKY